MDQLVSSLDFLPAQSLPRLKEAVNSILAKSKHLNKPEHMTCKPFAAIHVACQNIGIGLTREQQKQLWLKSCSKAKVFDQVLCNMMSSLGDTSDDDFILNFCRSNQLPSEEVLSRLKLFQNEDRLVALAAMTKRVYRKKVLLKDITRLSAPFDSGNIKEKIIQMSKDPKIEQWRLEEKTRTTTASLGNSCANDLQVIRETTLQNNENNLHSFLNSRIGFSLKF